MQYSRDGISWGFSSNAKFDADRIAKSLDLNLGDFLFFRERDGDLVQRVKYGKSNEKPKRQLYGCVRPEPIPRRNLALVK